MFPMLFSDPEEFDQAPFLRPKWIRDKVAAGTRNLQSDGNLLARQHGKDGAPLSATGSLTTKAAKQETDKTVFFVLFLGLRKG